MVCDGAGEGTGNSFVEGKAADTNVPSTTTPSMGGEGELAGNPRESPHFLGERKAKGLASDLQMAGAL